MTNSTLLPLSILYVDGREGIEGATRFQKLVFLAQEETDLPKRYEYEPDKYGPFSSQLHADLWELHERGLLRIDKRVNETGNEKYVYSITTNGIQHVKRAQQAGGFARILDRLHEIKDEYNGLDLSSLLRYVYDNYEMYTTQTEVDTDRLFDPEARSQFLEPEESTEYAGSKPGEWEEINSSAQDLFPS